MQQALATDGAVARPDAAAAHSDPVIGDAPARTRGFRIRLHLLGAKPRCVGGSNFPLI